MAGSRAMIELQGLSRHFGSTRAVDDVSFTVGEGEVFGYIGPNGAGKTTSMRIRATLDLPTSGDATIDGFSVIEDPDRVRRRLGFMPDYFSVYPNMNVWEYLDFYARAYLLRESQRRAALNWVMEFTGLDELAYKPLTGLSKGMKQRLCLGRALVHDPAVLVLDEPAAGLDPRARIEVRAMIRKLADRGKTVLISSHILTELAEVCDTVGIIEQGKLLAVGSVDDIQYRGQTRHVTVEARVLGGAEAAGAWLSQRDDVEGVFTDGELVRFLFAGDRAGEATLLKDMIGAGLDVVAFGSRRGSLEDVFMEVTRGLVQ